MPTALQELGGQLNQTRAEIQTLYDKKDAAGEYDWTAEDRDRYRDLEKKAVDLQDRYKRQAELEDGERKNREAIDTLGQVRRAVPFGDGAALMEDLVKRLAGSPESAHASAAETLAKAVTDHADFKEFFRPTRPVTVKLPDFDFKAVMTTAAGFAPPLVRNNLRVPFATRRPVVADLIPSDVVGAMNGVTYMEETTFTNNAAPVAEGGTKPESANAWTQRTQTIETIATTLPVTEQQLEDVPQIEALIRDRLTLMLMLAEEDQLLNGTGVSPQLQGILTKTGIGTQAAGTDPTPDVILKAMTTVAVTGRANANGVVLHPTNYQNMRLLRTADGIYIFGSPSMEAQVTIWGLTPVVTDAIAAGTGLVGDFRNYAHISRRKGITLDIGYVNDDFKRNQRTIRGEFRESLEVLRPASFVKMTGVA
jgi:HK97 family phage major capsid protein